jgi:lipid-binding SYLF domain-containing protein
MTKSMVKNAHTLTIGGLILVLVLTATPAASLTGAPGIVQGQGDDAEKLAERATEAGETLEEIMNTPDEKIPSWLLERAGCIAVIPKVVKVGFVVGGRRGKGLLSCKTANGWSRPSFVSLTGGSFGLQIGAEATDFVLVFASDDAVNNLFGDKFVLGADASVAAGPVGRTAEAATDIKLDHEIYSYSRSKGLFAGVSIEGAEFAIDEDANEAVYGADITARQLLTTAGETPAVVATFSRKLTELVPSGRAGERR